jgi:protocatechuate 3,4-dioxygenase beta subunit
MWCITLIAALTVVQNPALPECEWCGAPEAPAVLTPTLIMPTEGEAGERLIVEGTVYRPDGKTPAAGVLMYTYHTNAGGVYAKRGNETGNGRRHGYLRGWLRTGPDGKYRIETIKPGSYPSRSEPAHVHMTLQPPGEPERYIDDVVFEGDPLLTAAHRARLQQRGGSGIVPLVRGADGVFRATRDIFLGRQ